MTAPDRVRLPTFITAPDSQALCAEIDPEVWFPEQGGSNVDAKAMCARCELREPCLEWALTHDEAGVWGGKSRQERRRLVRDRAKRGRPKGSTKPINHGTEGGYKAHLRRGEPICQPCFVAAQTARAIRAERKAS